MAPPFWTWMTEIRIKPDKAALVRFCLTAKKESCFSAAILTSYQALYGKHTRDSRQRNNYLE